MNTGATFTLSELEAVLSGHRDGVKARLVGLLVLRGMDFRDAMRRFDLAKSTLHEAKTAVESQLYRTAAFHAKANEIAAKTN